MSISHTLLHADTALPEGRRLCIALRAMNSEANLVRATVERPIVLVGLMGVGKSTIGRRLAQRLHIPFVDADHEIEDAAGLSIPEIFDRFGEDHFRDGERRVIARLIDGKAKVIATGGGAFGLRMESPAPCAVSTQSTTMPRARCALATSNSTSMRQ